MTPRLLAALFLLLAMTGCKRHKLPVATRVWLGPAGGCGRLDAGELRCWGEGLGAALPADWPSARSLATLGDRSCLIDATDNVRCSPGVATSGLPTRGTTIAMSSAAVCVAVEPTGVSCTDREAPLLVGLSVKQLSAGEAHFCALTQDGTVRCWGENGAGQLGNGTTEASREPMTVHGIDGADAIVAGARHTCVRLRSRTVTCWGDNTHHQLANGTTTASVRPLPLFGLVGVEEIAAAGDGACARLADGSVRCWGRNDRGQLGDGTTVEHNVPMPVKWPK